MGDNFKAGIHLNPQQVIESGLPTLLIPPAGQTVHASSLTEWFNGDMNPWENFMKEVTEFYRREDLQKVFLLCEDVQADNHLEQIKKVSPHFAGLEHTQIGEERDLQGRFMENVIDRVLCVLKCITDSINISEHVEELKKLPLTNNVNIGSAKTVPKEKRKQHEPDIVFRIPGSGGDQTVRIVGELKFPRTCRVNAVWGYPESWKPGGMRHIFGQVARDMREHGVRYGFVSTYNFTVFLKISRQKKDGRHSLLCSEPIPHSQALLDNNPHGILAKVSVRFVMLWLILRAMYTDQSWSIETSEIKREHWTGREPAHIYGHEVTPIETPVKSIFKTIREKLSRMTLIPRKHQKLNPDPSLSHSPEVETPDDPNDPDYEDSENSTPSRVPVWQHDLDMSSDEEDDAPQLPPKVTKFVLAPGAQPQEGVGRHVTGSDKYYKTRSRTAR